MSLAIKYSLNTIGLIAAMKTVESSYSSKLKWTKRNKNSKNYGDSTSPYKIKITFKSKARPSKSSRKSIQFNTIEER